MCRFDHLLTAFETSRLVSNALVRAMNKPDQLATHWFRRNLPHTALEVAEDVPRKKGEDLAFFIVSFAAAFVILYGFIV